MYCYARGEHNIGIDINAEYKGLIMINIKKKFYGQFEAFVGQPTNSQYEYVHISAVEN